jgi:cyclopropane fatty-acyl-phospholipid synthase-like methyltransferase
MLELLDPYFIDHFAYEKGFLKKIKQYSLLPNNRIGWNYCLDYSWLLMRLHTLNLNPKMRIIDIGCGPGAIHGYLEHRFDIDIIGIDIHRWERDYVDIVGDFLNQELRREHGLNPESVDIIIATSAFEHNLPQVHQQIVEVCMKCLRSGGHLIATFSAAEKTYQTPGQWNLSKEDSEQIYKDKFDSFDYKGCWNRWRKHREIPKRYEERYGQWSQDDPLFLSAGAHIVKFF